ncbi:DUF6894 family protein [Methylobacterium iners]|uniref:DUF6894 domain-containing protein n=1 Tax=Methylobacterium iners TaxID=418707 RepID=A0ABQ4RS66_9HYPH|nr:hypothetical protein [Methylobacterium iners]GJD93621.1 hypothetical protein OCOJLMKI_0817 [Methylobacterium iners]
MSRYFFDVLSQKGLVCLDHEGLDCASDEAALIEARHGAGFASHSACERNPQLSRYRFAVADAEHRPLFTVPFTELLPDDDRPPPSARRRPRSSGQQPNSTRHAQ